MRFLGRADYRVMPWKNGGGTTTELMIWPEGSSLADGFDWRVSMADVAASGPFSRFPGYDRHLMMIEGRGMTLDGGPEGPMTLATPCEPMCFSGDWDVSGTLIEGPIRDFNLMLRRRDFDGGLACEALTDARAFAAGAGRIFVTILAGSIFCGHRAMATTESVLIEAGEQPELAPVSTGPARVAVCRIHPRS